MSVGGRCSVFLGVSDLSWARIGAILARMSTAFLLALCPALWLQSPPSAPPKPAASTPTSPTPAAQSTPAAQPAPEHPAFVKASGPHFEVESRIASQVVADQALAAAECTVAPIESVFGPVKTASADGRPLLRRIVVYAEPAEFDAEWKSREEARQKADGTYGLCSMDLPGVPHPSTRDDASHASYVLVVPSFAPDRLATIGLPMNTRRLIATEAAHLLVDETVKYPILLAPWFVEGASEWAAEEGFTKAGWLHDRMEEPTFAQLARTLPVLANAGLMPSLESVVVGLPAGLTTAERPAVDGAIFRFLRAPARAELFAKIAAAAPTFEEKEGGDPELLAALGNDAARSTLEDDFRRYVAALRPKWIEPLPAAWSSGSEWQQVATPQETAILGRDEPVESDRYALEGELEIQPGPTQQMNVLVCRDDGEERKRPGFVQVSFVAGYGIDVFTFHPEAAEPQRWTKMATVEVKGMTTGRWIPFRLQVEDGTLSVVVAGKPACSVKIDDKKVRGGWGLGVLAGSAGRWRKIGFG